jgi:hypothetical protein
MADLTDRVLAEQKANDLCMKRVDAIKARDAMIAALARFDATPNDWLLFFSSDSMNRAFYTTVIDGLTRIEDSFRRSWEHAQHHAESYRPGSSNYYDRG